MDRSVHSLFERRLLKKTIEALPISKSSDAPRSKIVDLNSQVNAARSKAGILSEQLSEMTALITSLEREHQHLSSLTPLTIYLTSSQPSPGQKVMETLQSSISLLLQKVIEERASLERQQKLLDRQQDRQHKLEIELEILRDKDLKGIVL